MLMSVSLRLPTPVYSLEELLNIELLTIESTVCWYVHIIKLGGE